MPRLTADNYKRPEQTYTEKLSKDEIKQKLEDYRKVDKIENVPVGTHVRYFTKKGNTMAFRLGGIIIAVTGLPDYLILSSGGKSWSVQVKNSIFFARISLKEIQTEYEEIVSKKDAQIKGLIMENKDLTGIIAKYKKKYGKI